MEKDGNSVKLFGSLLWKVPAATTLKKFPTVGSVRRALSPPHKLIILQKSSGSNKEPGGDSPSPRNTAGGDSSLASPTAADGGKTRQRQREPPERKAPNPLFFCIAWCCAFFHRRAVKKETVDEVTFPPSFPFSPLCFSRIQGVSGHSNHKMRYQQGQGVTSAAQPK